MLTKSSPCSELFTDSTRAVVLSPIDYVDRAKYDDYNNNLTLQEDITGIIIN